MNISEDNFTSWSQGPSTTEASKCENAENVICRAIEADPELQKLNITVFAQGSYRSRTNVRKNSDVDICVKYNGSFFPEYPPGTTNETFGNVDGKLPFSDFKNMLQVALENRFGKTSVTRGSKAFDVHANSYRIDADVVPTFEHRRYTGNKNPDGTHHFHPGVAFKPDNGELIKNWPQQIYDNGVARNTATGRKYKRAIRILKRLRDQMQSERITAATGISSFLIECLVWNADIDAFSKDSYTAIVRHVLANLWNRTRKDEDCKEWGEVNELKYLFRPSQPWTRQGANTFLQAAWDYIGYK